MQEKPLASPNDSETNSAADHDVNLNSEFHTNPMMFEPDRYGVVVRLVTVRQSNIERRDLVSDNNCPIGCVDWTKKK